ncbi:hypothetical protein C8P63_12630 [Melghirimyces profundicolus]|uniref:Uncharacterized protein n=1 Tax=Melghirimyces profundicolus TaxID=1242148 RepID=A0A2T6BCI1_9BACL|nr:hypothetical protein [Melghirimyces profundicolus]PTX53744.1 hypothetical protein C8P63_12630 [Melghirimyces profundicolus]
MYWSRSVWFKVLLAASLFFVSVAAGLERDAHADTSTGKCFWTVKMDPTVVNVAFPDTNVIYYMGKYNLAAGDSLTMKGKFPYARYMSFNAYDPLGQPIDSLADYLIQPDTGSGNPYLKNADPNLSPRDYTVKVRYGPKPANPEPNPPSLPYEFIQTRLIVPVKFPLLS